MHDAPSFNDRTSAPTLRFVEPATSWLGSSPLGNGLIGAMSAGGVGIDRLDLNHSTFWSGSPSNRRTRETPGAAHGGDVIAEARALLAEGRMAQVEALLRSTQASYAESFLPLGWVDWTLWINGDVPAPGDVTDYLRELNLETGELTWSYVFRGIRVHHRAWADRADDAIRVEIEASHGAELTVAMRTSSVWRSRVDSSQVGEENPAVARTLHAPTTVAPPHEEDHDSFEYGELPGMGAAIGVRLVGGEEGQYASGILTRTATDRIGLIVTVATGYRGALQEPLRDGAVLARTVLERSATIAAGDSAAQLERHRKMHRALFGPFSLELGDGAHPPISTTEWIARADGDPGLVALATQFGRYLLLSSSSTSAEGLPANLQGIWNDDPHPLWSSGYTVNINLQMNYWQAGPANLDAVTAPLWSWMEALAIHGSEIAAESYDAPGWVAHHNSDAWAFAAQVGNGRLGLKATYWPYGGVWLALMIWERFGFTGDDDWLRETGWPILRGAADFAASQLIEGEDGMLGTSPSTSPENEYLDADGHPREVSVSSTMDIELTRQIFDAVIDAARVLGLDDDVEEFAAARERLPGLRLDSLGRVLEWGEEVVEAEPDHRHLSHLIAMYPGMGSVDDEPELAAATEASLDVRGDRSTTWGLIWRALLRARLRDGDRAAAMLSEYLLPVPETPVTIDSAGVYGNLMCACPPFQIDASLGFPAVVCEMLVQSHDGEIHLLPALPERWSSGQVIGLRARPGVSVSLAWRRGEVTALELTADRDMEVVVRCGDTRRRVPLIGTMPTVIAVPTDESRG